MQDNFNKPDLAGRVAVVAGATRGVGRGIAEVLGQCGAIVYVTGRSTRDVPTQGNPEWSIDAVAEVIQKQGGTAIPVRCDHTVDDEVEKLFQKVNKEQSRLDILVNNLVGWSDRPDREGSSNPGPSEFVGRPVWKQPLYWWDLNFNAGVRAHLANCRFGIPLMLNQPGGLILFTSELSKPDPRSIGDTVLDLRAVVTARLVSLLAHQLEGYKIASVLLYPGWTRTEEIISAFKAGNYTAVKTRAELYEKTVSPYYSGRAVAVLAADPDIMTRSGQVLVAGNVAYEYDFTDIDGRQPCPL